MDVEILRHGESGGTAPLASDAPCDRVGFGADTTVFTTAEITVGTAFTCARGWSGLLRWRLRRCPAPRPTVGRSA